MDRILGIQQRCLKLTGFLVVQNPGATRTKWHSTTLSGICAVFIVASVWLSLYINAGEFVFVLFSLVNTTGIATMYSIDTQMPEARPKSSLLTMITLAPYVLIDLRMAIIATILFINRKKWTDLFLSATALLLMNANDQESQCDKVIQPLFYWACGHAVISLMLCFGYEGLDMYKFLVQGNTTNMYEPVNYYTLSVIVLSWQEMVRWICLNFPAAFLTNLAMSMAVTLAKVMHKCTIALNRDILSEKTRYALQSSTKPISEISHRLTDFAERHMQLFNFCNEFESVFGWMLFILWGFNTLTAFGFAASAVTDSHENPMYRFCACYSWATFLGASTLLLYPLASVFQEGRNIVPNLHGLSIAALSHTGSAGQGSSSETGIVFLRVLLACKDRKLVISGADLIEFSRGFFATTVTLTISFALLTYEVLYK